MSIDALETTVSAELCWASEDQLESERRKEEKRKSFFQFSTSVLKEMCAVSLGKCSDGNGFCEDVKGDCFSCAHQVEQDALCAIIIERAEREVAPATPIDRIVVESILE